MLSRAKWTCKLWLLIMSLMRTKIKLSKSLGKKIQKTRRELGLTQEELAEKVRISRAYMGYIEQGRNMPSIEIAHKIASALKIKVKDLLPF